MPRAKYSARPNSTSPTARASSARRGARRRRRSRLSTPRRSRRSSWPRRKRVSKSARRRSTATWRNSSARRKPNRPAASAPKTKAGSRASAWAACASAWNRRSSVHRQKDVALREARALEIQLGREAQEAGFSERECLSKLEDNARAAATATSQLQRIEGETAAARTEVAGISDTVLQEQLHAALDARQGKESALAERRNALESAAAELRSLDEQRLKLEQGVIPLRDKINDLRLKAQAAQMNEDQFRERLAEVHIIAEADEAPFLDELNAGGAERLKDSVLQGDIARLTAEIEALGPVNLAALEELATASPSARASSTRNRPT
jgi:hypothetical protein